MVGQRGLIERTVTQVAPSIWLKMKRQEAFVTTLGLPPTGKAMTAQEINQETFDWALSHVSESARDRFLKYGGWRCRWRLHRKIRISVG
jgi:hypothetical protein